MKVKKQVIAAGFLILLFSGACAHSPVQPTGDIKRIEQIVQFLDGLRDTLQAKDLTGLTARFSPDRQGEIQTLGNILDLLEQPRLGLFIDRILLDQDTAMVALHWEFRWGSPGVPQTTTRRGNATFYIEGTQELHLKAIEGENPFLAPTSALPERNGPRQ